MRTIALTRGLSTIVDDDVFAWASRHRWFAAAGTKGKWYAGRTITLEGGRQTTEYLHRRIAGAQRGREVDHRDGDTLNNRRSNLRVVTHRQNTENLRAGHGACGVRGVTLAKGRYRAQAQVNGKHLTFGTFDTLEAAAQAAVQGRLVAMSHSDGR